MAQGFSQNFKTRHAILVFLKNAAMPLVLYFNNPMEEYRKLQELLKNQNAIPKIIEKETIGPIKRISFMSNQICGVGIQEEQVPA